MFDKLKQFDDSYGTLVKYLCRIIFALCLYASAAYLDYHYVNKLYFTTEMTKLAAEKSHYAEEQKAALREINGKLDVLLLQNAANAEKFNDEERRTSRLEDRIDKLKGD